MTDIKSVLNNTEDLLKQAASVTSERAASLRETALEKVKQAKEKADNVQVKLIEKSKEAMRVTDGYIHDNPWRSLGIAIVLGMIFGVILNRK